MLIRERAGRKVVSETTGTAKAASREGQCVQAAPTTAFQASLSLPPATGCVCSSLFNPVPKQHAWVGKMRKVSYSLPLEPWRHFTA